MTQSEIRTKYQTIIKECKDELKRGNVKNTDDQIPELSWMILLKFLDDLDKRFSFTIKNYTPLLPENLRWSSWTGDRKVTDEKFADKVTFIFRQLGELQPTPEKPFFSVISSIFRNLPRFVTDGIRLRILVNKINELSFKRTDEVSVFEELYQNELFEMVKSANTAYYYTPRALAKLVVSLVKPDLKSEEKVFDPACGFGGFLIESLLSMRDIDLDTESRAKLFYETISGIEKDSTIFLCCVLNCMLNGLTNPHLRNINTMSLDTDNIVKDSQYDVIITNPTHGGDEDHSLSRNLPGSFETTDTSLHFLYFVMESLKENGRAAMIVTNGFLFGDDKTTNEYKKRLLSEFNLHTIVRLSGSVFEPYNSVEMNILFFEKSNQTKEINFYRFKIPERVKGKRAKKPSYGKNKPPIFEDFNDLLYWFENKNENPNVYSHKVSELITKDENENITKIDLDKKHPDDTVEIEILSPHELIGKILDDERKTLRLLEEVEQLIKDEIPK